MSRGALHLSCRRTLPPSHGPPQKRLIRGPRVGVIAADFADGSPVLAQVFKGSEDFVKAKALTKSSACVIIISPQSHSTVCCDSIQEKPPKSGRRFFYFLPEVIFLKHYTSKEVECPFYSQEDGNAIYCEGILPGTISTKSTFASRRDLISHKQNFCNDFLLSGGCQIYRSCNAKY